MIKNIVFWRGYVKMKGLIFYMREMAVALLASADKICMLNMRV